MDWKTIRRSAWMTAAVAGLAASVVIAQDAKPEADPNQLRPADKKQNETDKNQPSRALPANGRRADPSEITPAMREAARAQQTPQEKPVQADDMLKDDLTRNAPRHSADPADSPFTWSTMVHDWGMIDDTSRKSHTFSFTNTTDQPLSIRARGSCGCTVPQLTKTSYLPGESGEITVEFNPAGRRGLQTQHVNIEYTNAPNIPQTRLTIQSNVRPLVMVDPGRTNLPRVDYGVGHTEQLIVTSRDPSLEILSVTSDNPYVTVSVGSPGETIFEGEPAKTIPISVSIVPNAPLGKLGANISFETNSPRTRLNPHVVSAHVYGDLEATPQTLRIREGNPNTPFEAEIRLSTTSGRSFNIIGADVETSRPMSIAVDFETRKVDGVDATFVTLVGTTPIAFGSTTGDLIVKTDIDGGLEMRIPFYAVIRRPQSAMR